LGGITRRETLMVAITTAGVKDESPLAWRLHSKTQRIQDGVASDPTFYGRIYGADPEDDWEDEETWKKANPSLIENGGFLELSKIREKYASLKSEPDGQTSFRRYYLNLWDEKANRAIDMRQWNGCECDWVAEGWPWSHDFLARFVDRKCWVGVDLSLTTDMSAVTMVFPCEDGTYEFLPFYWLPNDGIRKAELRDSVPYQRWADEGFLHLSEGNVIDSADVHKRLDWADEMFDVQEFCFDRYNTREMSTAMVSAGKPCVEVAQNFTGLSEATKKFLSLVAEGKLKHGAHPILAWNAQCLSVKSDGNDLMRPLKPEREKESTRIDGVAAGVTAMARAVLSTERDCGFVLLDA
jgi:phage terminase large subunit-like protein